MPEIDFGWAFKLTELEMACMVRQDLVCDILMTVVNNHSHDTSSMKKSDLVDYADGDMDEDVLAEKIEEGVEKFPFLQKWAEHREERIHLVQESGEIVHYLVEECCEEPEWLEPPLDHVPNEVWHMYGVTPS